MWLVTFRLAEVVALDHPLNPLRRELRPRPLWLVLPARVPYGRPSLELCDGKPKDKSAAEEEEREQQERLPRPCRKRFQAA